MSWFQLTHLYSYNRETDRNHAVFGPKHNHGWKTNIAEMTSYLKKKFDKFVVTFTEDLFHFFLFYFE